MSRPGLIRTPRRGAAENPPPSPLPLILCAFIGSGKKKKKALTYSALRERGTSCAALFSDAGFRVPFLVPRGETRP